MSLFVNGAPILKIDLVTGVLEMLGDGSQDSITDLTKAFQRQGLGHIIESWIDGGPRLAISPEQVVLVLGEERIRHLAARAQLTSAEVIHSLTSLLPEIVEQLTPGGSRSETMSRMLHMKAGLEFLRQIKYTIH